MDGVAPHEVPEPRPRERTGRRAPHVAPSSAPVVFRPQLWLRAAVVAAVAVWVGVFFLLVAWRSALDQAYLSVAFFVLLFSALGVFYNNTSIEVTDVGLVVRGVTSFRLVPYSDVLRVEVKPGFFQTTYDVLARRGPVTFTNLFSGHQRLMALIVERSQLGKLDDARP